MQEKVLEQPTDQTQELTWKKENKRQEVVERSQVPRLPAIYVTEIEILLNEHKANLEIKM